MNKQVALPASASYKELITSFLLFVHTFFSVDPVNEKYYVVEKTTS